MVDRKRWQEAQAIEAEHPYHEELEDKDQAQRYLRKTFDVDWDYLTGKRVLEVGSGTGHIHSIDNAELAVGVDPLYSKIDVAHRRSVAELATAAGERLPFPSDTFDVVICINVLDHTLDPESIMKDISRVMKDDGVLLFQLNVFEIPRPVRTVLTHFDPPHPYHFSSREILNLLTDTGFSVRRKSVEIPSIGMDSSKKRIVARTLLRLRMLAVVAQRG